KFPRLPLSCFPKSHSVTVKENLRYSTPATPFLPEIAEATHTPIDHCSFIGVGARICREYWLCSVLSLSSTVVFFNDFCESLAAGLSLKASWPFRAAIISVSDTDKCPALNLYLQQTGWIHIPLR
ncbi:Hypothetical predicted protein, partial [Olea europaea subsp. europaea]